MDNSKFRSDDLDKYKTVFTLINKGGEGKITRSVIEDVLRNKMALEVSDETVDTILKEMNADEMGNIDFDSFMKTMKDKKPVSIRLNEVMGLFKNLDKDGDGQIGVSDWKHFFESFGLSLTENEVSEVIRRASNIFEGDDNGSETADECDTCLDDDVFYDAN